MKTAVTREPDLPGGHILRGPRGALHEVAPTVVVLIVLCGNGFQFFSSDGLLEDHKIVAHQAQARGSIPIAEKVTISRHGPRPISW